MFFPPKDLKISSKDIVAETKIDDIYAAATGNKAPVLTIEGVPAEAVELAVIVHDPDAPLVNGFTHLTVYGLAPDTTTVDLENLAGRLGPHGGGAVGYTGMEPPFGHGTHHYYFWVYALNAKVEGEPSREQFLSKYAGNLIEMNRFVATYAR